MNEYIVILFDLAAKDESLERYSAMSGEDFG